MKGMLGNRGCELDTGWLFTKFPFLYNIAEKNLLIVKLSVAKMSSTVYETDNCCADHLEIEVARLESPRFLIEVNTCF